MPNEGNPAKARFVEVVGGQFDKKSWLKYVISGIGGLALVVGGALMTGTFWWGVAVALLGLAVVESATYVYDRYTIREDARKALRQSIHGLVTVLEDSEVEKTLRANLMLIDGDALRMAYATEGYGQGEWILRWHKGQGCCGVAWEERKTMLAPADLDPPEIPIDPRAVELDRAWNMSKEQIEATPRLTAVISVPVRTTDEGTVLGVFNVDDTKEHENSVLTNPDAQGAVEAFGTAALRPIIERAGTDIPGSRS